MRITVNLDRCIDHGGCEALAPDVFEVQDEGFVAISAQAATACAIEVLQQAVSHCPSGALQLQADDNYVTYGVTTTLPCMCPPS